MEEEYIPKVGDIVYITKGFDTWNETMDQYVGTTQIIEEVFNDENQRRDRGSYVHFVNGGDTDKSQENSLNCWYWRVKHGHFVFIRSGSKKSLKLKFKTGAAKV